MSAWSWCHRLGCVCCFLLLVASPPAGAVDVGFELLFTSNDDIYDDLPVKFDAPIPTWIKGNHIINGLGRFEMGQRTFTHAFDGFAKLNSWKFYGNGTVHFTFKFLQTNCYRKSRRKNDIAPYLMLQATRPPFSLPQKVLALLRGIDNTNAIVQHFGRYYSHSSAYTAVSDFWPQYEFNPQTLDTSRRINARLPFGSLFYQYLPVPSSPHPVREFGTDYYINFYSLLNPIAGHSSINVIRIASAQKKTLIATISRETIPYMHSMGVSRNYAIIFAHPAIINPWTMIRTGVPLASLDWKPEVPTDVYVVRLRDGHVTTHITSAVFNMHQINSFELKGKIYVDMVTYEDLTFMKSLELSWLRDPILRNNINANATLKRYGIDPERTTVHSRTFQATSGLEYVNRLDLPAINENYRFKPYCFIYGIVTKSDGVHTSFVSIVKKDLCRPNNDKAWNEHNHYPSGDPRFLATPSATAEDEGMLICLVLDGVRGRSYLVMLDAQTMRLVVRGYVPTAVPFTLHGQFFPLPPPLKRKDISSRKQMRLSARKKHPVPNLVT